MDKKQEKLKKSIEEIEKSRAEYVGKINKIKARQKEILEEVIAEEDKKKLKKIQQKLKSS